uniref:39S ribosomal protein L13, mitochondrial n=1 Tax=Globodera pallida TaxID=36090 RepID=A0A183CJT4_GLOPA
MSALATRAFPSRAERVRQWMLFSRQWHVIDADRQDIWKLAKKVAKHLSGWWKPIHHPHTDCGDHVVVVNCTDASMHAFDWKHTHFFFDRQYPKSKFDIPAYQIHEYDPCRVIWMCIGRELAFLTRNRIVQRRCYERLHVFPDLEMPDFVRKNINNQLRQVQDVPRKSTEYTSEERAAFPRIFRPDDYFLKDWEEPIEPERWHPHERLKRGEEVWDKEY